MDKDALNRYPPDWTVHYWVSDFTLSHRWIVYACDITTPTNSFGINNEKIAANSDLSYINCKACKQSKMYIAAAMYLDSLDGPDISQKMREYWQSNAIVINLDQDNNPYIVNPATQV